MAGTPTWQGLAEGLVVLGLLWWSWGGYTWLTSAIDPELVSVRLSMFAAMAALLVTALAVPHAYGNTGLLFAASYTAVRIAHIILFALASRDDSQLRRSVIALGSSTFIAAAILLAGLAFDGSTRLAVWSVALVLDLAGPFLFGAEGWKLAPGHFAERHGLIVIIALGESIATIGVGAQRHINFEICLAAVLGMVVSGTLWWVYFDVLAHVAEQRLTDAPVGRQQNEMARDAYSYMHFLLVAGIVLFALALKKTLLHVDDPLTSVTTAALVGGPALYLAGLLLFGWRTTRRTAIDSIIVTILCIALYPVCVRLPSLQSLSIVAAVLSLLIAYKVTRYHEVRRRIRGRVLDPSHGIVTPPP